MPPERLGAYLRELEALFARHGYDGRGLRPFRRRRASIAAIDFDLRSRSGARELPRVHRRGGAIWSSAMAARSPASMATARRAPSCCEIMYGPELVQAFREFKAIWDPDGQMNPGKVVDPFPITSNLRLGPDYQPAELETHFAYPDDDGSFAHATMRCVGVGKCRRRTVGDEVMCPSYLATGEEKHSTRGRARLLHEMLRGEVDQRRLAERRGRGGARPLPRLQGLQERLPGQRRHGDLQGRVPRAPLSGPAAAARRLFDGPDPSLGARSPSMRRAWQLPEQTPVIARSPNGSAGSHRTRTLPRFAAGPSGTGSARRPRRDGGDRGSLLWPDTFNNYFRPETAIAATRLLEQRGLRGRHPAAAALLRAAALRLGLARSGEAAAGADPRDAGATTSPAGTPLVGLEPACVVGVQGRAAEPVSRTGRTRIACPSRSSTSPISSPPTSSAFRSRAAAARRWSRSIATSMR